MSKKQIVVIIGILFIFLVSQVSANMRLDSGQLLGGTIKVYGESELEITPDQARVSVGVEIQAEDAQEAVGENARVIKNVLAAVDQFGAAVSSVTTGSYQVYAIRHDEVRQYMASNQLQVTLDDLTQLGELIDVMIAAGANRVLSVQFEASNSDEAKLLALGKAVEQARGKAQALAAAADVELGDILSITEESGSYTPYQMADMQSLKVAGEATTEIRPGNIRIQARVGMEYRITP